MPETFEQAVAREVERFRSRSLASMEREILARRMAWLRAREWPGEITPRRAFEALFFEQMGLDPAHLPVVRESRDEIVWESRNPCRTLEACRELCLETRPVCRRLNEKATQAFFSHLDPRLRFVRDYNHLRPEKAFCAERLVRVDFEALMRIAIDEARLSRAEGDKGYGAVIARGGRVIAQAHDTVTTAGDPTLHAEVNAIRRAIAIEGETDLCGAILVSTCEPCPMCSSLAVWSNVTSIVYGASIRATLRLGKRRIGIGAAEVANRSPVLLEVIGGVLEDECLELYRGA